LNGGNGTKNQGARLHYVGRDVKPAEPKSKKHGKKTERLFPKEQWGRFDPQMRVSWEIKHQNPNQWTIYLNGRGESKGKRVKWGEYRLGGAQELYETTRGTNLRVGAFRRKKSELLCFIRRQSLTCESGSYRQESPFFVNAPRGHVLC